jgi:hypothetical protein
VAAVIIRNLQYNPPHSTAYFLRPNLFLSTKTSDLAEKTRKELKAFNGSEHRVSVSRLLRVVRMNNLGGSRRAKNTAKRSDGFSSESLRS